MLNIKKHSLDPNYEYVYYVLDMDKVRIIENIKNRIASKEILLDSPEAQIVVEFETQIQSLVDQGWKLLEVAEDFKKRKITRYRRRQNINNS